MPTPTCQGRSSGRALGEGQNIDIVEAEAMAANQGLSRDEIKGSVWVSLMP